MHSQAVRAGNLLFISGQVPLDRNGNLVGRDDARAQAEQVYQNLQAILAECGLTFANVTKVTTYITDRANRMTLVDVKRKYFGDALPASTNVVVAGLVEPDFLCEVEAIAVT